MGKLGIFLLLTAAGIAYLAYKCCNKQSDPIDPSDCLRSSYFGKGLAPKSQDTTIRRFSSPANDKEMLTDLHYRLKHTRYSNEIDNAQDFSYGIRIAELRKIVDYWLNTYNWAAEKKKIFMYDHFVTSIEGIDIHFVHVKSKVSNAPTILLLHGWPGSFWEFYKSIPLLKEFNLVIPSIPGYGFSEPAHKKGFDAVAAARVFNTLLTRLGYKRFFIQGGDWGSAITSLMAQMYPESIRGLHLNMEVGLRKGSSLQQIKNLCAMLFPSWVLLERDQWKQKSIWEISKLILEESGYMHIQSTKPNTVGGCCIEKKLDGGLSEDFTLDEMLTNVMIYWTTGSITSSQRFYYEYWRNPAREYFDKIPITVPSAIACFPNEILCVPETLTRDRFTDLVQYTDLPKGGHFAAFQVPELFANDVKSFIKKVIDRELTKQP